MQIYRAMLVSLLLPSMVCGKRTDNEQAVSGRGMESAPDGTKGFRESFFATLSNKESANIVADVVEELQEQNQQMSLQIEAVKDEAQEQNRKMSLQLEALKEEVQQLSEGTSEVVDENDDDEQESTPTSKPADDKTYGKLRWDTVDMRARCATYNGSIGISPTVEGHCGCNSSSEMVGKIITETGETGEITRPACRDHGRRSFIPDENMNPLDQCECKFQKLECSLYMDSMVSYENMIPSFCRIRTGARVAKDAWICVNDTKEMHTSENMTDYLLYQAPGACQQPPAPLCDDILDRCFPTNDPNRSFGGNRGMSNALPRVTRETGALCLKNWQYKHEGEYKIINHYCGCPDEDAKCAENPDGWCKLDARSSQRQGKNWGWCSPLGGQ